MIAGRDGGLQSMELLGVVMLRISDPEYGHIRITVNNQGNRPLQFQVGSLATVTGM